MELKLKICGMRDPKNIEEIALLRPDYLGLIFYEKSPRYVSGEIAGIGAAIKRTGVFVDASEDFILEKIKKYELSAVQLHGDERPGFCSSLKKRLQQEHSSVEIIKVFGVKDDFDFQLLEPYEGIANFYLFDTPGKRKGGNGIRFDWKLLQNYSSSTPFFLSGGIGEEEAKEIEKLYADFKSKNKAHLFYGLDVNSKFETEPGLKNVKKLKHFKKRLF